MEPRVAAPLTPLTPVFKTTAVFKAKPAIMCVDEDFLKHQHAHKAELMIPDDG